MRIDGNERAGPAWVAREYGAFRQPTADYQKMRALLRVSKG
jgi:hypothetical protein